MVIYSYKAFATKQLSWLLLQPWAGGRTAVPISEMREVSLETGPRPSPCSSFLPAQQTSTPRPSDRRGHCNCYIMFCGTAVISTVNYFFANGPSACQWHNFQFLSVKCCNIHPYKCSFTCWCFCFSRTDFWDGAAGLKSLSNSVLTFQTVPRDEQIQAHRQCGQTSAHSHKPQMRSIFSSFS